MIKLTKIISEIKIIGGNITREKVIDLWNKFDSVVYSLMDPIEYSAKDIRIIKALINKIIPHFWSMDGTKINQKIHQLSQNELRRLANILNMIITKYEK